MKAVIQRVSEASVSVSGDIVSTIGKGLCILVGINRYDKPADIQYLTRKILNIRLFDDNGKRWKKSVKDLDLEILCVSQFTLYCELKGNAPDFHNSMAGDEAKLFYDNFLESLRSQYKPELIKDGVFGAAMDVSLVNMGPVTICLDSPKQDKK